MTVLRSNFIISLHFLPEELLRGGAKISIVATLSNIYLAYISYKCFFYTRNVYWPYTYIIIIVDTAFLQNKIKNPASQPDLIFFDNYQLISVLRIHIRYKSFSLRIEQGYAV